MFVILYDDKGGHKEPTDCVGHRHSPVASFLVTYHSLAGPLRGFFFLEACEGGHVDILDLSQGGC